ncbi:hypothetical protein CC80DRAFT_543400 [Byssothecium circinans]|uniref:Uncharacterized protein n=1 Tax=Byssothecium circinans TaxID=147558 RepID=A0A6A5UE76_9PLEO|nr:hypothetical protein CC80DRAFT_543400 [Byssothecium circinans]
MANAPPNAPEKECRKIASELAVQIVNELPEVHPSLYNAPDNDQAHPVHRITSGNDKTLTMELLIRKATEEEQTAAKIDKDIKIATSAAAEGLTREAAADQLRTETAIKTATAAATKGRTPAAESAMAVSAAAASTTAPSANAEPWTVDFRVRAADLKNVAEQIHRHGSAKAKATFEDLTYIFQLHSRKLSKDADENQTFPGAEGMSFQWFA